MRPKLILSRNQQVAPALRRDLECYARHAPTYDVDRGLERLTLALTAAAGVTSATSAASGLKLSALKGLAGKLGALPGFKVLAICVAVGAAGTAAVAVTTLREEPPPGAPLVAPTLPPARSPAPASPAAASPALPANEPPMRNLAPASPPRKKAPAAVAAPAPSQASARAEMHDGSLREEMAALVRLRALAANTPAAAVTLAAECDARYGKSGVFGEEREAIAVIALADSGRGDEARARGEAFLALHPRSPFAARVAARVRAPAR